MLPIVDAFRHAATITPTSTPKIESMHTNYGSLLNYILMVFTKYGFQEFAPGETSCAILLFRTCTDNFLFSLLYSAVGDAVDAAQHEILEVREPDNASDAPSNATHAPPGPVVVEVLGTGWRDAAQVILRYMHPFLAFFSWPMYVSRRIVIYASLHDYHLTGKRLWWPAGLRMSPQQTETQHRKT